eukprot:13963652-Alexandrium_andersonii.AAC.1
MPKATRGIGRFLGDSSQRDPCRHSIFTGFRNETDLTNASSVLLQCTATHCCKARARLAGNLKPWP